MTEWGNTARGEKYGQPTLAKALRNRSRWQGSWTELLEALRETKEHWPQDGRLPGGGANRLSQRLDEIEPLLNEVGIEVERGRDSNRQRDRWVMLRQRSVRTRPKPRAKKRFERDAASSQSERPSTKHRLK